VAAVGLVALPRPRRTVPHCAVPPPGDGGPDESSDDPDESSGESSDEEYSEF